MNCPINHRALITVCFVLLINGIPCRAMEHDSDTLDKQLLMIAHQNLPDAVHRARDLIIQGADPAYQDSATGMTPLLLAVTNRNDELANLVLTYCPEEHVSIPLAGSQSHRALLDTTLVGDALFPGSLSEDNAPLLGLPPEHLATTLQALTSLKRPIDMQDIHQGYTALMIAAQNGDRTLVEMLLAHGADVRTHNIRGQTALSLTPSKEIAQRLIQHGAGPLPLKRKMKLFAKHNRGEFIIACACIAASVNAFLFPAYVNVSAKADLFWGLSTFAWIEFAIGIALLIKNLHLDYRRR